MLCSTPSALAGYGANSQNHDRNRIMWRVATPMSQPKGAKVSGERRATQYVCMDPAAPYLQSTKQVVFTNHCQDSTCSNYAWVPCFKRHAHMRCPYGAVFSSIFGFAGKLKLLLAAMCSVSILRHHHNMMPCTNTKMPKAKAKSVKIQPNPHFSAFSTLK